MTATVRSLDELALDLDGELIRPTDAGWNAARQAWNLAVGQHPAAVAVVRSTRDVVNVIDAARELRLRVSGQSTGHNAGPLGDLRDTVLIRTGAMRDVQIDPIARVARIEAGAWWQDVTEAAAKHGLAALAGSAPDVGVAGYTLGGGISWLARSHGLAANSVLALEVVTADGRSRHVDAAHDPELFWALRGGGGSFAVVTAIEMRLYPITEVYAGVLFYPADRTLEVLRTWRALLPDLPESVTTVGRVLNFPPLPQLPPHLAGQSFVVVEASCQLSPADADKLLAPLRALGPAMDTFRRTPVAELAQLHMDPPEPVPAKGDGILLTDGGNELIDAFARAAAATSPALLSLELRQLGGAIRRGDADGGAVNNIDADFALFAVGMTPTPESVAQVSDAVTAVLHRLTPWATGRCYLNFAETHKHGAALFGAETHARLRQVKRSYDPTDLIRSNHPVQPA